MAWLDRLERCINEREKVYQPNAATSRTPCSKVPAMRVKVSASLVRTRLFADQSRDAGPWPNQEQCGNVRLPDEGQPVGRKVRQIRIAARIHEQQVVEAAQIDLC